VYRGRARRATEDIGQDSDGDDSDEDNASSDQEDSAVASVRHDSGVEYEPSSSIQPSLVSRPAQRKQPAKKGRAQGPAKGKGKHPSASNGKDGTSANVARVADAANSRGQVQAVDESASTSSMPAKHFAAQLSRPPKKRLTSDGYRAIFDHLEEQITKDGRPTPWSDETLDARHFPLATFPESAILFW
jgi:hypothetical protein